MTVSHLCAVCGLLATGLAGPCLAQEGEGEPPLPESVKLYGVVRDFRPHPEDNGHPDFQRYNTGHRAGWVATELDDDGKPQRAGGQGYKVDRQAKNSEGDQIFPLISQVDYMDARPGDQTSRLTATSTPVVTSDDSFYSWYRNVHGVNLARTVPITLELDQESGSYIFHQHDDMSTSEIEGFFPIDGEMYGNPEGDQWGHNYHFTFELDCDFVYKEGGGQVFTFYGDDDVWVFIDGKLVIDIGGVHGAVSQSVELDRLNWLEDGKKYDLKLFFAERHYTRSNCRIETNLLLKVASMPVVDALWD